MTPSHTDDSGFNLMELMVVVAIMGILVSIAFLSLIVSTNNARRVACKQNQRTLTDSVSVYSAEHETVPGDVNDLAPYVSNFATTVQCTNRDGVLLEYDSISGFVTCENHP